MTWKCLRSALIGNLGSTTKQTHKFENVDKDNYDNRNN